MNWNYWLPWRSLDEDDSEDSSYETEVIERCDHDFEQSVNRLPHLSFDQAVIEDGYLVVPQYEVVTEYCVDCGEPGYMGEADPYDGDYFYTPHAGEWTRVSRKLAFEIDFEIDPDRSVSDAFTEPVDEDDEPGRVLVNKAEDEPVAAGGATD